MIDVVVSDGFKKKYDKRVFGKLKKKVKERIEIFRRNKGDQILRDHCLEGAMKDLRSFSITGDIRIVYREINDGLVEFLDIGSHNQVY